MRTARLSQLHVLHAEAPAPVASRYHALMSGLVHVLRLYMKHHRSADAEARDLWNGADDTPPLAGRIACLNFDIAELERR